MSPMPDAEGSSPYEPSTEDEKRANAHKALCTAQENYLIAAGWVRVEVKLPVGPNGGLARDTVWMWARELEVLRKDLRRLYSLKLALQEAEESDGYTD